MITVPNIVAALILIWLGLLIGKFAGALVRKLVASSGVDKKLLTKNGFKSYGKIVHVAIMIVAVFMILNQLGIATVLVNAAFIIALAAIAVAFAISFGIGGRDFAKKQLGDLDVAIDQLKADSKAAMEAKEKEGAKKETAKRKR